MSKFLKVSSALLAWISLAAHSKELELSVGSKIPFVEITAENGGKVDGLPWSSSELSGKVWSIFYVDPDERDLNQEAQIALKSQTFQEGKFASAAIINLAATFIPNFILNMLIESSQKEYNRTVFIKDKEKIFVRKWGLADHSSNVVIVSSEGVVEFLGKGKLSRGDIQKMLEVTHKAIQASLP